MKLFQQSFSSCIFETYSQPPAFDFLELQQVHGTHLNTYEQNMEPADGWLIQNIQTPLAIKTADCLPILLIGTKGIAFLHAGWKGLRDGIFDQPQIHALDIQEFFIGPCIHQENYKVQKDFQEHFSEKTYYESYKGNLYFDLVDYATDQLQKTYPHSRGDESGICTFSHSNFHSFRENRTDKRNYNIIRPHL